MTSLIQCRKCGGPHVTLKCGKEKQNLNELLNTKFPQNVNKPEIKTYQKPVFIDKKKIVTVCIANLPEDMTVEELTELVSEWGKIGRVNLTNNECKTGFIDFYYVEEAEYFVKAIDKTKFDYLIITAEILVKNNY